MAKKQKNIRMNFNIISWRSDSACLATIRLCVRSVSALNCASSRLRFFSSSSLFSAFIFSISTCDFVCCSSSVVFCRFNCVFSSCKACAFLFSCSLPIRTFSSDRSAVCMSWFRESCKLWSFCSDS